MESEPQSNVLTIIVLELVLFCFLLLCIELRALHLLG
jgi:hypothetical protein